MTINRRGYEDSQFVFFFYIFFPTSSCIKGKISTVLVKDALDLCFYNIRVLYAVMQIMKLYFAHIANGNIQPILGDPGR